MKGKRNMMWGKHFKSMYEGSLIGAGSDVFVVMGYIIPHMEKHWVGDEMVVTVKLNPKLLAAVIGATEERMQSAIDYLCAPDPISTSPEEGGRRLVKMGQFEYRVVNGPKYIAIRDEEDRRLQNREAQQRFRANRRAAAPKPNPPPPPAAVEASKAPTPARTTPGNKPPSVEAAIAYFDLLGFFPDEVRRCHKSFEDRKGQDGKWMWGAVEVDDWQAKMFTRMTDDRKGNRTVPVESAQPPKPQFKPDPDDAAFRRIMKNSEKIKPPMPPAGPPPSPAGSLETSAPPPSGRGPA